MILYSEIVISFPFHRLLINILAYTKEFNRIKVIIKKQIYRILKSSVSFSIWLHFLVYTCSIIVDEKNETYLAWSFKHYNRNIFDTVKSEFHESSLLFMKVCCCNMHCEWNILLYIVHALKEKLFEFLHFLFTLIRHIKQ